MTCKAFSFLALFFLTNFSPPFLACSYQLLPVIIIAHLWCQECHLQKIVDCRTLYYVLRKAKQTLQLYDSKRHWIITAARLRVQGPLRRSHRKGNEFFWSDFCDHLLAARCQTACAVCSSQPMQFGKIMKLFRSAITEPLIHFLFPSATQQTDTLIELR